MEIMREGEGGSEREMERLRDGERERGARGWGRCLKHETFSDRRDSCSIKMKVVLKRDTK